MSTPPMPMVQVFAPDGTLGDIPYDRLHDALGQGAKIAAKVKAPDGTVGFVPGDRVPDALKAGGQRVPLGLDDADGGKENGFWQQGWKNLQTPRYDRVPGGGEEMRIAQGAPVGAAILGGIGTAGAGLEAAGLVGGAGPSLAPLAPLVKGAVGSAAGGFVGREAGKVVGQEQLGGQLGALAGGIYGAGGGKIPTNMAELESVMQSPEAKARMAQEIEGQQASDALKLQDTISRRAAVAARAEAKANVSKPLSPVYGPPTPTQDQLAQGVKLSDLVGEKPSGITVVPEPRAPFAGETPNYMASVPRGTLQDLALAGKPGAAKQIQQLGGQVLYAPPGAGISNVKSSVPLSELVNSNQTLNPVGGGGARPIVSPADQFESSFGPEHQEVGDLAEWETGNREGVKVGSSANALDSAAKSIFGAKDFSSLSTAQKTHILRIAQTQVVTQ